MKGFGYHDSLDFLQSSFGFVNDKSKPLLMVIAMLSYIGENFLGFKAIFLLGYFLLISLEWGSGIAASRRRGEAHESRKLGRMILKIGLYTLLIGSLNMMAMGANFPSALGFELDPFQWIYWLVLVIIIWQLVVSVLENFTALGQRWAGIALKIINRKFYEKLDLQDDQNKP